MAIMQQNLAKAYGLKRETGVPQYVEQEVLSWSKEKVILKMYDLFIISAKKKDVRKMNRVLAELMASLNFDYEETATRLYRLYEYIQRLVFQKRYDDAIFIIQELRNAWNQAFEIEK
ncbi:MAG: flagellar protein FliS [Candidatus Kapaibacteriota bacterium]